MINIEKMLQNRGYWEEADDGKGGAAGDGGTDDSKTKPADDVKPSDDEKTKPTDDGKAALVKEVMQKKQAIKDLKGELDTVKLNLAKFANVDVEEFNKMIAERKTAEERDLENKKDWDTLKTNMREEHQKATAGLESEIETLKKQLSSTDTLVDKLTVGNAFGTSKFISDEMNLSSSKAKVIYGTHFDIDGASIVAYDKPRGQNNRVPLVDANGDNMTFDIAMRAIIDKDPDKDSMMKSKIKPGSNSGAGSDKGDPKTTAKLSSLEKISAGLTAQESA